MGILGNVGYLYMRILLLLLIVGLGSAGYWTVNFLVEYFNLKGENNWGRIDWVKVGLVSLTALVLIFILEQFFKPQAFFNNLQSAIQPNSYLAPQEPLPLAPVTPSDSGQAHSQHH